MSEREAPDGYDHVIEIDFPQDQINEIARFALDAFDFCQDLSANPFIITIRIGKYRYHFTDAGTATLFQLRFG